MLEAAWLTEGHVYGGLVLSGLWIGWSVDPVGLHQSFQEVSVTHLFPALPHLLWTNLQAIQQPPGGPH